MPNKKWSELNGLQLGRYGEYFAKMEFASYGFDVYTSEVDDHGIDFVVKNKQGKFFEVQVKAIRIEKTGYVFMRKDKFSIEQDNLILMLLLFEDGMLPRSYLIHSKEWAVENDLFRNREYEGLKSKPEYGLNISKKNMVLLDQYSFENIILNIKGLKC
ncbi:DUF4365 domain-containing protein [Clostridium sp.]|uniref:DUF4365 domain-containing protein n=1 Tax=Clostridium sp. TaxID=1506 RepID=UPI003464CE0A